MAKPISCGAMTAFPTVGLRIVREPGDEARQPRLDANARSDTTILSSYWDGVRVYKRIAVQFKLRQPFCNCRGIFGNVRIYKLP